MFSKKKSAPSPDKSYTAPKKPGASFPSVLASDLHIIGNIVNGGIVDIDGRIEGNVRCHTATVRKNGHVKGDLVAETVSIYGKVQGLIKARSVNFFKGCRVEGVIHHETITIEDGAFVDGRFKRTDRVLFDEPVEATLALSAPEANRHPFHANFQQNTFPAFDADAEVDNSVVAPEAAKDDKNSLRMLENLKLIGDSN